MRRFKQAGQFVSRQERDIFGAPPINHDDFAVLYGAIA
jgi:hypothetical protein